MVLILRHLLWPRRKSPIRTKKVKHEMQRNAIECWSVPLPTLPLMKSSNDCWTVPLHLASQLILLQKHLHPLRKRIVVISTYFVSGMCFDLLRHLIFFETITLNPFRSHTNWLMFSLLHEKQIVRLNLKPRKGWKWIFILSRQEKVNWDVRRIFDDGLNLAVSLFSSGTFFEIRQ